MGHQWEAWGLDCSGLCHGLGGWGVLRFLGPREASAGGSLSSGPLALETPA